MKTVKMEAPLIMETTDDLILGMVSLFSVILEMVSLFFWGGGGMFFVALCF